MYCIECGANIPENSKFCSLCGKKQTEAVSSINQQIAERIIENEIVKQIIERKKQSINYQFIKKTIGWYLAWIVIHLCILLIFSRSIMAEYYVSDRFWPFSKQVEIGDYDYREFLVYSLLPFAFIIIISLVSNESKENIDVKKNL